MSLSTNTTYKVFLEKLGGTDPATYVGDAGEVFFDPSIPALKLSDGSTAGGIAIGGGGGGSIAGIDTTGTSFFNNLTVTGVSTLGNTVVGGATTELIVNGDARITGILTIGTASITIDPSTNTITANNIIVTNGSSQPYYAEPHSVNDGLPIQIGVAVTSTKQTTHRFFGTGGGYSYLLNSQESPYLNLIVGKTYWFAQEDESNAFRPIKFFTDISHNTEYTDGVSTPDGILVGNPGFYTELIVTETTPNILYYDNDTITDNIDGYMGNQLNIIGSNKIGTGTTTYIGETTIDGRLSVNTIEGTGEVGVTRMLLQASNNGNSYISIPTDDASTTTNLVIGNESRAVEFVGAVVLDGTVNDPNLTGGSNVTPTNIPLTQSYFILNEGSGGLGYFNLPDGQEGQIVHLVMGSTDSLLASDIHVIMASGRYLFAVEGGGQQAFTGALDVQPFTEVPTAMVTMMYAGGYWTVTHGTVTED